MRSRIFALLFCALLPMSSNAEDPAFTDTLLTQVEQSLEENYQQILPVLSAIKMVLNSSSVQEREYAIKYLKRRTEALSASSRLGMIQIIELLETSDNPTI